MQKSSSGVIGFSQDEQKLPEDSLTTSSLDTTLTISNNEALYVYNLYEQII